MRGPLGALPALSATARRALISTAVLSLVNAGLLVAQAFLLADVLASIVGGRGGPSVGRLAVLLGLVAGRTLVVLGYGWTGRGVALRSRGAGASVNGACRRLTPGYRDFDMADDSFRSRCRTRKGA